MYERTKEQNKGRNGNCFVQVRLSACILFGCQTDVITCPLILVGNREGKRSVVRRSRRLQNNIKMDHVTGCEIVEFI